MAKAGCLDVGLRLSRSWAAKKVSFALVLAGVLAGGAVGGCAHGADGGNGSTTPSNSAQEAVVDWRPWTRETFSVAAQRRKLLLVSVQASWCHWCHVMNDQTFGDRAVREALAADFVAVKVDSDARPDLAERFRDYAWPATVILSPDGEVLVPMRGYQAPRPFLATLRRAVAGDFSPVEESSPVENTELGEARTVATQMLDALFDREAAGWGRRQKYPYLGPVEHAFFRAQVHGEANRQAQALRTLEGTRQLIDPVFGGVYQYSLRGRWDAPHYEKIAAVQADALEGFAWARLRAVGEESAPWAQAMNDVIRYLRDHFSSDNGAFYTSQDADLNHEVTGTEYYALSEAARLRLGQPRRDMAHYVDLNARLVHALVVAHRAGANEGLAMAEAAMNRMQAFRQADGGYAHGGALPAQGTYHAGTNELRYLRDQAHALRAELALYDATGDLRWRERAGQTAAFVLRSLRAPHGFYAHTEDPAAVGAFARRRTPLVENGVLARGLTELSRRLPHRATDGTNDGMNEAGEPDVASDEGGSLAVDGAAADEGARHALGVASADRIRAAGRRVGDFLMALEERAAPYVMVSVVGPALEGATAPSPESPGTLPTEPERIAQALRQAAVHLPQMNRLVEFGRDGTSRYPFPGQSAAFLCNESACSRPVFEAQALPAAVTRFLSSAL